MERMFTSPSTRDLVRFRAGLGGDRTHDMKGVWRPDLSTSKVDSWPQTVFLDPQAGGRHCANIVHMNSHCNLYTASLSHSAEDFPQNRSARGLSYEWDPRVWPLCIRPPHFIHVPIIDNCNRYCQHSTQIPLNRPYHSERPPASLWVPATFFNELWLQIHTAENA